MVQKRCSTGLRHYRTRDEIRELVTEYEASGLGLREFCRQKDIPPNTLARYRKRCEKQAAVEHESDQPLSWVSVEVAEPRPAGSGLALVLRGGRRIELAAGFDPATLERLVVTLERIG